MIRRKWNGAKDHSIARTVFMTSTSLRFRSAGTSPAPHRRWLGIAAALALLAVSGCSPAPTPSSSTDSSSPTSTGKGSDTVVAKVNGTEITEGDLAIAEEDVGQNMPPMAADAK